jgi:hypothetical protein
LNGVAEDFGDLGDRHSLPPLVLVTLGSFRPKTTTGLDAAEKTPGSRRGPVVDVTGLILPCKKHAATGTSALRSSTGCQAAEGRWRELMACRAGWAEVHGLRDPHWRKGVGPGRSNHTVRSQS